MLTVVYKTLAQAPTNGKILGKSETLHCFQAIFSDNNTKIGIRFGSRTIINCTSHNPGGLRQTIKFGDKLVW